MHADRGNTSGTKSNYDYVNVRTYRDRRYGPWMKLSSSDIPERIKSAIRLQVMTENSPEGIHADSDLLWLWRIG
jgi:hypothetical protein